MRYDLAVIGGGLVGLATADAFLKSNPGASVLVLEKEPQVAAHQSSRNSGVIHSGIYYKPGSMKAKLCMRGARMMRIFCREREISFADCGKIIVATRERELEGLQRLHERGLANGVEGLAFLDPVGIRSIEPHACGLRALRVPGAGIADYPAVARALAGRCRGSGADLRLGAEARGLRREPGVWRIETSQEVFECRVLVNCAGLHADRVAAFDPASDRSVSIVPFRGEYYELVESRRDLVKGMIYPVPDPAFPFLGVHFTRDVRGGVHAGPNAVLALKREGYLRRDMSVRDMGAVALFPGFWRLAARHWRVGIMESWRSTFKTAFVRALQRLVPEVRAQDLKPAASGVRAQALDREGRLLDDFDLLRAPGAIHVRNVPSPAATACFAVGEAIAALALEAREP